MFKDNINNKMYINVVIRISIRARCTTLCDKVCQWLATGLWFSPSTLVSSTNKTDCYDITEILLKVALNTINNKQTISMLSVVLVEEISYPEKNHPTVAGHWQTLSHKVVLSTPLHRRELKKHNLTGDSHW